jgi:energy-converting hydrogenase Eha subunit A
LGLECGSGTIADVFPSMPKEESWDDDASREIARSGSGRALLGAVPESPKRTSEPGEEDEEEFEEIEVVPVRRQLSLAIAGFAALLGLGLALGAQTSAPDYRWPYAIVLFGVQLLYLLAWIMALHPPAVWATAGVCAVAALVADYFATTSEPAALLPLILVALGGIVAALIGQLFRAEHRKRVTDSWRTTSVIVLGVVAYAIPVVLTRQPVGTQTIVVCAAGAGVALLVARATDAIFPKPRIAPQVPRGATGVVLGAMLGTLASATLGSVLVLPFTPAKGAVIGLIAAVIANLVDLAVNFGEAGRRLAGDAPTFFIARHMQGPLGAFALTAPAAYALTHWYLT